MATLSDLVQILSDNKSLAYTEEQIIGSDDLMTITGSHNGSAIKILLTFSIAPSLQSMLSRRLEVRVTAQVLLDGVSALWIMPLSQDQCQAIGSIIAQKSQEISSERDRIALASLEMVVGSSMTKK